MKNLKKFCFYDKELKNVSIEGQSLCFYLLFCFCELEILIPFINSLFKDFSLSKLQAGFVFLFVNLIFIKVFFGKNILSKMILGRDRLDLKIAAKDFFYGLFFSFCLYPVMFFIGWIIFDCLGYRGTTLHPTLSFGFDTVLLSSLYNVYIGSFIVIAIEQAIIRCFIQNFFKRKYGNIISIIITAVFFVLINIKTCCYFVYTAKAVQIFLLSLFCGLIYGMNGTALASMGFYIGYNIICLIVVLRFFRLC